MKYVCLCLLLAAPTGSALLARRDGTATTAEKLTSQQERVMCYMKNYMKENVGRLPPAPEGFQNRPSCSIVSSSSALLKFNYGKEIDNHDVVIRMNQSPTKGFEKYVGGKCSFRLGWKLQETPGMGSCGADFPCLVNPQKDTGCYLRRKESDEVIHWLFKPALDRMRAQFFGGVTTGFESMLVALSYCDSVDAYQMTPSSNSGNKWAYYQQDQSMGLVNTTDAGGLPVNKHGHPFVRHEWSLWKFLSTTSESEVSQTGIAKIEGFNNFDCTGVDTSGEVGFEIPLIEGYGVPR